MNEVIRDRWIDALRTGILPNGDKVVQTKHYLRVNSGSPDAPVQSCCLGVLCEIAVADGVVDAVDFSDDIVKYVANDDPSDYSVNSLPVAVLKWAGLDWDYNSPHESKEVKVTDDEGSLLTALNDYASYTFAQIADVIEEQL